MSEHKPRGDVVDLPHPVRRHGAHAHHQRTGERAGGGGNPVGPVHGYVAPLFLMPRLEPRSRERLLEAEAAAEEEAHRVFGPERGDVGDLVEGPAAEVTSVARQVSADVRAGGRATRVPIAWGQALEHGT